MNSIRHRTLTLIIGLLLVGLLILTVFNVHDSNHEIAEVYDAQLAQNARLLEGVMRMPLEHIEHEKLYQAFNHALAHAEPRVDGHPYESKIAFQVWDKDGKSVVHTASAPAFINPAQGTGFSDLIDMNKQNWRCFVLIDAEHGLRIWVGERDDVRSDIVNRIVRHTVLPNMIGSLLLIISIWLAIGWGLKPLANFASTLRERHSGSLEPLRLSPLPSELEPMQAALNRLLGQIQDLLSRERRLIADAAHEMRTPLAILRVHAQNVLEARNEEQRRESLSYLIIGVDRTTRLINQLLTIARLEPSPLSVSKKPVDVVNAVRESLVQLTPWVLNKGLELSYECIDQTHEVSVDFAAIDIALHNLITNAVNFSPAGGQVTVGLFFSKNHYWLTVDDQGPGIDEMERERLFEPFYSRGNDQGVGLGLAIVKKVALLVGGEISLDNLASGGLRASLKIPLG
ncbi:ATP-binding protein [Pseudomonas sp. CCI3.2]|uniref:ATP-binding protein n=1 Tax=unclassified Pseudomonas TaxID=196821 RepID=UPI002AC9C19C|nr:MULTISPECIES: ATP-binding protein [unclassified Pseudomonas]MEB0076421.1 ATP-binding protein [Pseudomonas sp. MH10out]MEB0091230.1 ATP-binding protein [Pseudomonas sp. CCI4.2]MEB0100816.1 ATP-binding protein [Pseudomonas sp. CCI3.2]MEB0128799.1 ATP-binding protein [Pseudomonas sp. CCI2.4]MEB0156974.1 ATP-binding protein [Pseudomonas sp. AH2 (2023)]